MSGRLHSFVLQVETRAMWISNFLDDQHMFPLDKLRAGQGGGILFKLQNIVKVNQLEAFYPPQALQALAEKIDLTVNFDTLAAR